jgi:hypothetical protein
MDGRKRGWWPEAMEDGTMLIEGYILKVTPLESMSYLIQVLVRLKMEILRCLMADKLAKWRLKLGELDDPLHASQAVNQWSLVLLDNKENRNKAEMNADKYNGCDVDRRCKGERGIS